MSAKPQRKILIQWSGNFAYALGLITSDGSLNKDGRHLWFSSKDLELVENLKKYLKIKNKISRYVRGGEKTKRYYYISFGDLYFYRFLNKLGLFSNKSKTIKKVTIPKYLFPDFLRGLFDGDGTFYTFWDRRWSNSFGFKLSFASASRLFIEWLKMELTDYYGVRGFIHKGDGVFNLEYVKGDTRRLFEKMYSKKAPLFLKRKYFKLKDALEKDRKIGLSYLQKCRTYPNNIS